MQKGDDVILIGKKPVMNYVLAAVTIFNGGGDRVQIRARGRAISRAVDVAEILRNRFIQDAVVDGIEIGTEKVTNKEGRDTAVSAIEIILVKTGGEETGEPAE